VEITGIATIPLLNLTCGDPNSPEGMFLAQTHRVSQPIFG